MTEALYQSLIHPVAPPPVPWWPPAPGWWILLVLALVTAFALPWLILRWKRLVAHRRKTNQALKDIPADLPDQQWLSEINSLLKRLLIRRGEVTPTRLFGKQWLDYLCSSYPRPQRSYLAPLAADLYRQAPNLTREQRRALVRELRRWMRHNHV
ncbi:DUF4381 domain-containing protein [Halopseudomonas salina]|uniref:DUF4381 domain-containing protein n=1 Tax=Halopseudomonas salina TaxID=1323744 RepID=A0ABQ1Q0P5_9GAMM|nr:DUF4381 domain-containing protein [Halopseudomonas salina]GGD09703.1 hypothetical protein GCM10007418_30920 [Halopseudomonas salina]